MRLPDVEGLAVCVRELVVDCVLLPELVDDLDRAAETVDDAVPRAVELIEGLTLCVRDDVVVREEDILDVALLVPRVVQVVVALAVVLRVG